MSELDPICRGARREMVGAMLDSPPRRELPATLADHVAVCRDCAGYWRNVVAAARLFPRESVDYPQLRARALAAVARERERARPVLWVWLVPAAAACMVAAYGIPACVLSNALGSVLGSPDRGFTAALLVIGSWLVLLPASLAASLVLRTPQTNGSPLAQEKGVRT